MVDLVVPLTVAAYIAISDHNPLQSGQPCIHLEQIDTDRALRRHGLLRELLRQLLQENPDVTQVTLCVAADNHTAQAVYRSLGFECLEEGDEAALHRLSLAAMGELRAAAAATLSQAAPARLSFAAIGADAATMLEACDGAASAQPSPERSCCAQIRDLCAENLPEYTTGLDDSEARAKALRLLTATDGVGEPACVRYRAALIPRLDMARARARAALCESAGTTSTDAAVRVAYGAWERACAAAAAEEAAVARITADGEQKQRRVYFVGFSCDADDRGYVGHEHSHSLRKEAHLGKKGGAAWTATYNNDMREEHFRCVPPRLVSPLLINTPDHIRSLITLSVVLRSYHDWSNMTKLQAVVDELVTLMRLSKGEPARDWRGGPFLVTSPRDQWDPGLSSLWEALARVEEWPDGHAERLSILLGILHLLPSPGRLWCFLADLCFKCGMPGHFAENCRQGAANNNNNNGSRNGKRRRPESDGISDDSEDEDDSDDEDSLDDDESDGVSRMQ